MAVRIALLLRGVNVGGHNRLTMARLRELGGQVGGQVGRQPGGAPVTYLQSGNLVVTVDCPPDDAAAALRQALVAAGLDVPVLVRTGPELAAVLAANPLGEPADPARLFVSFCAVPVGDALAGLDATDYAPEAFGVVGREIYAWLPDGMQSATLTPALWERRLRGVVTARNWRTVQALADLTGRTDLSSREASSD